LLEADGLSPSIVPPARFIISGVRSSLRIRGRPVKPRVFLFQMKKTGKIRASRRRFRAEARGSVRSFPQKVSKPGEADGRKLLRELQAHQVKLEQQNKELQRVRSEVQRLVAIMDSSNDAIVSRDLQDRITTWNKEAVRMFGYSKREVLGRDIALLAPQQARAEVRNQKRRIMRGERIDHFDTVRIGKNGRQVPVSISVSPVQGVDGRIIGISTIMRDIAAQKQRAEALSQSEHYLAEFFDKSPLGLMWIGPYGDVLRVNQAQLELLDRPAENVLGRRVGEFHVDAEIAENFIERLAAGETLQNRRARFRQPDGSIKHVLIDANGLWRNGALAHSRWFVRDITRRIELEREILAIAEQEQLRIGRDLHDDLGQQLAGIEFLAQSLIRRLGKQSKEEAAHAREIAAITRQTMVRTRELARGLSPIGLESNGLMHGLRDLAARTRKIFDVDCRFRCPAQVPVHDHTVAIHLYRIAQEAVSNAIRHGKARRIDIGLALNGDRIVLAISDNGIGMPKKATKHKGFGLRIMQYRAGVIDGSLLAQRQPNGGTAFVCTVREQINHLAQM
jgi:PAS domain S-box-containing protein